MTAADQRERLLQRIGLRIERADQAGQLAVRDILQVLASDLHREIAARRVRIELRELQLDAFGHAARADAGGVERLDEREHVVDLVDGHRQIDAQVARDLLERLGHVAIVVERIDDRFADPDLARVELADLELPDQVLVQIAAALVRELERPVVVALRAALAGRNRAVLPRVDIDDDFLLGVARGRGFVLRRVREIVRLVQRRDLDGFVFLGLEHHVVFERLLHLRLELEHGELQQLDRLLQLRRHRQLLAEFELQRRLEHVSRWISPQWAP
jgi:hypothetical protein